MEHELLRHLDPCYREALYLCRSTDEANELVQEAVLCFLEAREKGRAIENPRAWLIRVIKNKHYARLREKYGKPTISYEGYIESGQLWEEIPGTVHEELERREAGKIFTSFLIYTKAKDTEPAERETAEMLFAPHWEAMSAALTGLRGEEFYQRHAPHERGMLESYLRWGLCMMCTGTCGMSLPR